MLAPLPYSFHDGILIAANVGPRREVTLVVGLDQPGEHITSIRFGGIVNFEESVAFFARARACPRPAPEAYFGRIDALDYDRVEPSRVNRLVFRLELEWHGQLVLRCRNVTAWENSSRPDV